MQCGPVRFAIDSKSEKAQRPFEHRLICRETGFRAEDLGPEAGICPAHLLMARSGSKHIGIGRADGEHEAMSEYQYYEFQAIDRSRGGLLPSTVNSCRLPT